MTEYDSTNTGLLTANERRRNDRDPSHQGSAEIVCQHCRAKSSHWLSAWVKVGREGTKLAGKQFFSLAFRPKDQQGAEASQSPRATAEARAKTSAARIEDFDDSIPFAFAVALPLVALLASMAAAMPGGVA